MTQHQSIFFWSFDETRTEKPKVINLFGFSIEVKEFIAVLTQKQGISAQKHLAGKGEHIGLIQNIEVRY